MPMADHEKAARRRAARTRRIDLSTALASLSTEELRETVKWLAVPRPRPTRKAEMAVAVEQRLTDASLREYWNGLDGIEQMAVREVLYGREQGIDWNQFGAKHGALPASLAEGFRSLPLPLRFYLFRLGDHYGRHTAVVPAEVARRLLEFVPPPPEAALAVAGELPAAVERQRHRYVPAGKTQAFDKVELVRRDMEFVASRDLPAILRLIDLGRVAVSAKTRRPSAVTVRRIAEELDGGDFFDVPESKGRAAQQVGPIRAFAWPWLLQAGKLATLNGSKLALTKAGRFALGAPAAVTLRRLWQHWVKNSLLDEFSRVEAIKGQQRGIGRQSMFAPSRRRPVIAEAMAECPVGAWVYFDEFSRFMQASGMEFGVSRNPWNLYIAHPNYGSLGYAGHHDWDILQGRYLRCLLFEYAATLGLIDVAYTHPAGARNDFSDMWGADELEYLSRYDGLEYFRLTPLGAYCLELTRDYEPTAKAPCTPVTVLPSLRVCASAALSAQERLVLETFASAESDGVWRLDRDKSLLAIESGHKAEDLRTFLAARDEQPLPELVDGFLRNVERGARALKARGTALLIECIDEHVADRLVADERTSKLCLRAGKKHLVVRSKAAAAFHKAARMLGYGMPRD